VRIRGWSCRPDGGGGGDGCGGGGDDDDDDDHHIDGVRVPQGYWGLPVVDGDVIALPLLDALSQGLVDVTLVVVRSIRILTEANVPTLGFCSQNTCRSTVLIVSWCG
jgi:hypothetical protein